MEISFLLLCAYILQCFLLVINITLSFFLFSNFFIFSCATKGSLIFVKRHGFNYLLLSYASLFGWSTSILLQDSLDIHIIFIFCMCVYITIDLGRVMTHILAQSSNMGSSICACVRLCSYFHYYFLVWLYFDGVMYLVPLVFTTGKHMTHSSCLAFACFPQILPTSTTPPLWLVCVPGCCAYALRGLCAATWMKSQNRHWMGASCRHWTHINSWSAPRVVTFLFDGREHREPVWNVIKTPPKWHATLCHPYPSLPPPSGLLRLPRPLPHTHQLPLQQCHWPAGRKACTGSFTVCPGPETQGGLWSVTT